MSNPFEKYKFRGKSKNEPDKWIYGSLVVCDDGECYIYDMLTMKMCEVDPKTVGQYSGRTDKNGTKIFDGDILCVDSENCVAYFDEDELCWYLRFGPENCNLSWNNIFLLAQYGSRQMEVIGNIHDNPELLGGETDE